MQLKFAKGAKIKVTGELKLNDSPAKACSQVTYKGLNNNFLTFVSLILHVSE